MMKKLFHILVVLALAVYCMSLTFAENAQIKYRLSSADEAARYKLENSYIDRLNAREIEYLLRAKGATRADYERACMASMVDFQAEDEAILAEALHLIEANISALGLKLPIPEEVVFALSDMRDEANAGGYTLGNRIYLASEIFDTIRASTGDERARFIDGFTDVVAHELFHVMSRMNRSFREKMYNAIGAHLLHSEPEIPAEMKDVLLQNPDVERLDCAVPLSIEGRVIDCMVFAVLDAPYEDGAGLFGHIVPMIMTLDGTQRVFRADEVPDFATALGGNTNYEIAIEEAVAVNFSYAVNMTNAEVNALKAPEVVQRMRDALK